MKTETSMLPEKIVSQTMVSMKLEEFNTKFKLLVSSYVRLPSHLSEEALPRNPKLITQERLEEYVKKMQEGLPEEGKNVWQKLYSDAVMQIKLIRSFFESFPMAEFSVDDNISTPKDKRIKCTNKLEVINAASTVEIPTEYRDYFEKVKTFGYALSQMHDYESLHGLKSLSLEKMIYYAQHPYEFTQKWLGGGFEKVTTQYYNYGRKDE